MVYYSESVCGSQFESAHAGRPGGIPNLGRERVEGQVIRPHKKTVAILTEDGRRWNVSPGVLRLAKPVSGWPCLVLPPVAPFKQAVDESARR